MADQNRCDDCGARVAEKDAETLRIGSEKRWLCEDCYLAQRRKVKG